MADRRRLDSGIDPYAHLRVRRRAPLEAARGVGKAGAAADAAGLRAQRAVQLTPPQAVRLAAYWEPYVQNTP